MAFDSFQLSETNSLLLAGLLFTVFYGVLPGSLWASIKSSSFRITVLMLWFVCLGFTFVYFYRNELVFGTGIWIDGAAMGLALFGFNMGLILTPVPLGRQKRRLPAIGLIFVGSIMAALSVLRLKNTIENDAAFKSESIIYHPASVAEIKILSNQVPSLIEDNFTISANNGKIQRSAQNKQPIYENAFLVYAMQLSATLQPTRKVSGAMSGKFTLNEQGIETSALLATQYGPAKMFRCSGALSLEYAIMAGKRANPEKIGENTFQTKATGYYLPLSNRIIVNQINFNSP